MRVAVVQLEIPIQSYTRDLLNGLHAQGCELVLVTRPDDWPGYVDPRSVQAPVHLVETEKHRRLLREIRYTTVRRLGLPVAISPAHTHQQAQRILRASPGFDLVIGIEKAGLEIAARFAQDSKVPFVYYSLELYLEDHPDYRRFKWKRRSEIQSHRLAAATIVQDRSRWSALKAANGPLNENVFFLPVGVPTLEDRAESSAHLESATAPHTVLYLGLIRPSRFADELLQAASTMPGEARLHMHGPISAEYAKTLARRRLSDKVTITSNMLDEAAVNALVSKAAIGLALYRRDYANDRLTAFSSQKIAMYLRAGIPIITFKSESYVELFSRYLCGEMIDDFSELPTAIEKILERRAEYSRAAREAFAAIFDIDLYWAPLGEFLAGVAGTPP